MCSSDLEVGDVELDVENASFLVTGMIEIDVGHGDVELWLPRDTHANLVANAQEGGAIDVDSDELDVTVLRSWSESRDRNSRRAELQIGRGGGDIRITMLSGEISIEARR